MKDFDIQLRCENFYKIPREVAIYDKEFYRNAKELETSFFNYAEKALKNALQQMPVVDAAVFRFEITCCSLGSQYPPYYSPEDTEIKERLAVLLAIFLRRYKIKVWKDGKKETEVPAFKISFVYDETTNNLYDGFNFRVNPELAEFEAKIKTMAIRAFPAWFAEYKEA